MRIFSTIRCFVLLAAGQFAASLAHADEPLPRQDYLLHCMGCHGENGAGLEGRVPSLRGSLARLAADPQGRRYVVGVPGISQSSLDAQRLADLLNWSLREFSDSSFAGRVKNFSAAEILAARAKPLLDVTSARSKLTVSQ